jgi:uncharacterized protein
MFVSDVHEADDAIEWIKAKTTGYDAIIVGGDLAVQEGTRFGEGFLQAAVSTGIPVYFVPGNLDSPDFRVPKGVVDLHRKKAKLGAYNCGGLGGSNITPFDTPFELSDEMATRILDKLGYVDILVSHCPPEGTACDLANGRHIGSVPVRRYVEREQPLVVLCGHAHDSRGVGVIGSTRVVNAGPLKRGLYAEVTMDGQVKIELKPEQA